MILKKGQWIIDIIAMIAGGFLCFIGQSAPIFLIAGIALFFYGFFELIFTGFKIKNSKISFPIVLAILILIFIAIFIIANDRIIWAIRGLN